MIQVGAYEARTHLSRLLERVRKGEQVVITKYNVPVAKLVPVDFVPDEDITDTIAQIRRFRVGKRLHGAQIRELIEEGPR